MKFSVIGLGYVGLSISILLSQKYKVDAIDIDKNKLKLINDRISPIQDKDIEYFFRKKNLNIKVSDKISSEKSKYYIVCTPTNYNELTGSFDTKSVELVIRNIVSVDKRAIIIIKSTIPLGFTDFVKKKFKKNNIFFYPEFLRESNALYDNLYPSRIIAGGDNKHCKTFAKYLVNCALKPKKQIEIIQMSSKEAESVKLFANTYLAMRVSFFNELDTFCELNNLNSKNIIKGISLDPRIGMFYNNPSFGYGGYCLPKDTKQLLRNFNNIPNNIITAVIKSNRTRKKFIAQQILNKNPKVVGIYRLTMKNGSDNFRESAIFDVMQIIKKLKIKILVYEPLIKENNYKKTPVIKNFREFIKLSDVIIANRLSKKLKQVKNKVYSRDVFKIN